MLARHDDSAGVRQGTGNAHGLGDCSGTTVVAPYHPPQTRALIAVASIIPMRVGV